MPILEVPRHHATSPDLMRHSASVIILLAIISGRLPAAETQTTQARVSDAPESITKPVSLDLEAHALEDGLALGGSVTRPLANWGQTRLLAEAYGFKGDSDLGGFGGGLILRQRISKLHYVELNAFFDALQDREGFSYTQLGVGIAYAQPWFTARVNGYFPLSGGRDVKVGERTWTQTDRNFRTGVTEVDWSSDLLEHRSPGMGFDAEVEVRLPNPPRWIDPHLAVGYYYRAADDRSNVYSGALLRGELHFGEKWAVEGEWRSDAGDVGQEWRVVVRYQVQFGGRSSSPAGNAQERWMEYQLNRPVERRPWPVISRSERKGDAERGNVRFIPLEQGDESAGKTKAADCCPTANDPLIFD